MTCSRVLILILSSIAVVSQVACASEGGLHVRLSTTVSNIYELEAVPFSATFTNVSDVPVQLRANMFEHAAGASLSVRTPDRGLLKIDRPGAAVTHLGTVEPRLTLEPQEHVVLSFTLSCQWDARRYPAVFDGLGEYEIWLRYADNDLQAESNRVRVRVDRAPLTDKESLALVRSMPWPGVLYDHRVIPFGVEDAIRDLEAIAASEDSVVYANYARLVLAELHLDRLMAPHYYDRSHELNLAREYTSAIKVERFVRRNAVEQLRERIQREEIREDEDSSTKVP